MESKDITAALKVFQKESNTITTDLKDDHDGSGELWEKRATENIWDIMAALGGNNREQLKTIIERCIQLQKLLDFF